MILLLATALAAESPAWHAAQARQFLKRGWLDDADAEVRTGLLLDPAHVELNALCVELARGEGDIERALACASAGAAADTGDLDARAALSQAEAWLRSNFGFVEVRGPAGIGSVRAAIVSTSLLLDEELRAAVTGAGERARKGLPLPSRLALPAGDYTLHGERVHVEAGGTSLLTLPPSRFPSAAARGKRLDLGVGVAALSGHDLANQLPGLETELGFSAPLGTLRIGAAATWALRGYSGVDLGHEVSPYTIGGVLRLGMPLEIGKALVFAPGASLAGGMLPGLELACTLGGSPMACRPGRADADQLPVYATGFALVPGASFAMELNVGPLVLGLRGGIGHVFGVLPTPGVLDEDGQLTDWVSEPDVLHGAVYSGASTLSLGL